jgi:hypothetical protein
MKVEKAIIGKSRDTDGNSNEEEFSILTHWIGRG